MDISRTRSGFRLSQHGVVLSELRISPGPTHSVFDVLAAIIAVVRPRGRIGVLGFAGGSIMAPLRGLGMESAIDSVDLDRAGYEIFREHCHAWAGPVNWQQCDAVEWLQRQTERFAVLLDDLSVSRDGDIVKPMITWEALPELIRDRLAPGGIGIFNLLEPPGGNWSRELNKIGGLFKSARLVDLEEFENRFLVGGDSLPSARDFGVELRSMLRRLRSRQANRIRLRNLRG